MNKTVRALLLLQRCYGGRVPVDSLLDLFDDCQEEDVNAKRRKLRRYLDDFKDAGIDSRVEGRGSQSFVVLTPFKMDPSANATISELREEVEALTRRLDAEREAALVFRDLLARRGASPLAH